MLNALHNSLTGGQLADGHQGRQVARTLQPRDKYLQGSRTGSSPAADEGLPLLVFFLTQSSDILTPSDGHKWEGKELLLDSTDESNFSALLGLCCEDNQSMATFQVTWCSCWGSVKVATA